MKEFISSFYGKQIFVLNIFFNIYDSVIYVYINNLYNAKFIIAKRALTFQKYCRAFVYTHVWYWFCENVWKDASETLQCWAESHFVFSQQCISFFITKLTLEPDFPYILYQLYVPIARLVFKRIYLILRNSFCSMPHHLWNAETNKIRFFAIHKIKILKTDWLRMKIDKRQAAKSIYQISPR